MNSNPGTDPNPGYTLSVDPHTGFTSVRVHRTQEEEDARNKHLWLVAVRDAPIGSKLLLVTNNYPLEYEEAEVVPPRRHDTNDKGYVIRHIEKTYFIRPVHNLPWSSYDECYSWYLSQCSKNGSLVRWSKEEWSDNTDKAVQRIDSTIREDHGLIIYKDGNHMNHTLQNIVCVHIVDALLIQYTRKESNDQEQAAVVIRSPKYGSIQSCFRDNFFDKSPDQVESDKFICDNRDMFLVIFSLWGNFSKIPIRVLVHQGITEVDRSRLIINDAHFIYAQRGKRDQMRRGMQENRQRNYYGI